MKPYELSLICESMHLRTKDNWEQARLVSYIIAQVNSKKRLKPSDIIKFAWEDNGKQQQNKASERQLTKEYVEQIKMEALKREQLLKEKGII